MSAQRAIKEQERIEAYKSSGKHIIIELCNYRNLPEHHELIVEEVPVYPNEVYSPSGTKGFTLHLAALQRLGNRAAIEWIDKETKAQTFTPEMCHYTAVGFYRTEYDVKVAIKGEGSIILQHLKEDLEKQWASKAREKKKDDAWARHNADNEYRRSRNKMSQLAKSEAYGQVYRKLLGLEGSYKQEALNNPLIIIRCVVTVDYSDPEMRKLLLARASGATDNIYGPERVPIVQPLDDVSNFHGEQRRTEIPEGMQLGTEDPGPTDPPSAREVFMDYGREEKLETIGPLIKQKGYVLPTGKSGEPLDLEVMNDERLGDLHDHLLTLTDVIDDNIPF